MIELNNLKNIEKIKANSILYWVAKDPNYYKNENELIYSGYSKVIEIKNNTIYFMDITKIVSSESYKQNTIVSCEIANIIDNYTNWGHKLFLLTTSKELAKAGKEIIAASIDNNVIENQEKRYCISSTH